MIDFLFFSLSATAAFANAYLNSSHYSSEYNNFYSTDLLGKKTEEQEASEAEIPFRSLHICPSYLKLHVFLFLFFF